MSLRIRDDKVVAGDGVLPACCRPQEQQFATTAKSGVETRTGQSSGRVPSIESERLQKRVGSGVSAGGTSLNCTMLAKETT